MRESAPPFGGFFQDMWTDRGRVLAAGISAVMLWLLLGQKVNDDDTQELEVQFLQGDELRDQENKLFIRVPENLAAVSVAPKVVKLMLVGTREDIARLDRSLRGIYELPADFCDAEDRRSIALDVVEQFDFNKLALSPSVSIDAEPDLVEVTVAKRDEIEISLGIDNIAFAVGVNADNLVARFDPGVVTVSGPADVITELRSSPGGLKVSVSQKLADQARDDPPQSLAASRFGFLGSAELAGSLIVNENRPVRLSLLRETQFQTVALEEVEVVVMIPKKAWRENVDPRDPVELRPPTVSVVVQLPHDYHAGGDVEEDVRQSLNLFLNLGEMPFNLESEKLPVRHEGLPPGAMIEITPAVIDVEWKKLEPVEPADPESDSSNG